MIATMGIVVYTADALLNLGSNAYKLVSDRQKTVKFVCASFSGHNIRARHNAALLFCLDVTQLLVDLLVCFDGKFGDRVRCTIN